jgi:hypothetical protein
MAFANPTMPNLADFTAFVYAQGVPTDDLPSDSPYLQWSFNTSVAKVINAPACIAPIIYVLAVYNLGMHTLLKIGQDESGQTFFADQRKTFNLLTFTAGPVQSAADQATSDTLVVPDFLKTLTLADLDLLKTPWGREYLAYAQEFGPNVVGVT